MTWYVALLGLIVAILTCISIVVRYIRGHHYATGDDVLLYGAILTVLLLMLGLIELIERGG